MPVFFLALYPALKAVWEPSAARSGLFVSAFGRLWLLAGPVGLESVPEAKEMEVVLSCLCIHHCLQPPPSHLQPHGASPLNLHSNSPKPRSLISISPLPPAASSLTLCRCLRCCEGKAAFPAKSQVISATGEWRPGTEATSPRQMQNGV